VKEYRHGTTIIAVATKTHIALAADSLESWGYHPTNTASIKISRLKPHVYIGCAGDAATADIMVALLQELVKKNPCPWYETCQGFRMILCGWTEVDKDPVHKGIAKTLLTPEAEGALGIIVAPEGIFKILSTGEFGLCNQDVLGSGCGGEYAEGAARAMLLIKPAWSAQQVARKAVKVAADSVLFANDVVVVRSIKRKK